MPTAAKLIAAIFFLAFGYFAADLVKPLLPEGTKTTWLNETIAAVGFVFGWGMAGKNAGQGYKASMGFGLTTVALIIFWGVFIFAGVEMLLKSISAYGGYNGPMQAIKSMIRIMVKYFRMIATQDIIIVSIIGGIIGGYVAEWAAKRWS